MNVLIVKLTSMGDLVQALPALTDASGARPGLAFDWVVDEAFAEVPSWHPAVNRVIKTAHRRWRKGVAKFAIGELGAFVSDLRQRRYDAVIDAQTNLKSSLVTRLARGPRHGPDRASVREWPAHWAYQHHYTIERNRLAIDRWRQLFAAVLGYPQPDTAPDFGLNGISWRKPEVAPAEPYLVFVPNASWDNKYWTESHWRDLVARAVTDGYQVLLTWGSDKERMRTESLAKGLNGATVLPRMNLTDIAGMMVHSGGTIAMDTGLAHVSAALGVPTVTLYGPTDPALIGATGARSSHVVASGFACMPCYRRECNYGDYRGPQAQCLKAITPERVWHSFGSLSGSARLINKD
ncbi:MAG: lipopolysaccharide heptosyltransferase I [Porticoccaceae bacterium]|nr:lipopolysaccharide heptosyltransferase I [Porticoccaceae bacterium]